MTFDLGMQIHAEIIEIRVSSNAEQKSYSYKTCYAIMSEAAVICRMRQRHQASSPAIPLGL
jgi:hypothetical protein